jgi:hypothetical protein
MVNGIGVKAHAVSHLSQYHSPPRMEVELIGVVIHRLVVIHCSAQQIQRMDVVGFAMLTFRQQS